MSPFVGGAIELSLHSNPLNSQTLCTVLSHASSTNQQQIRSATQQLQNWETYPGYYSSLQSILIDKALVFEVRYLSSIQLKNGVDKYWRKHAPNAIKKEEKALIRSRCLEYGINETDYRLALQNALLVAKIARLEFPHDWPDVVTSITQYLRLFSQSSADQLQLSRTLLILLFLVKELAAGRLQRTRASLQTVTPEVFQVLGVIYVSKVQEWLTHLYDAGNSTERHHMLEQSLLGLRVLRRLLVAGYEIPNRHREVHDFWGIIDTQFRNLLTLLADEDDSLHPSFCPLIERHLMQISKLHLEMIKVHPAAFSLLPNAIDLIRTYWDTATKLISSDHTFGSLTTMIHSRNANDGDDMGMDRVVTPFVDELSLKALLLLRGCVKMVYNPIQTFKIQHAKDKEERTQAVQLLKGGLLSDGMILGLMETLIIKFFMFRSQDLREWEENPEEWEQKEENEGDAWEFSIRSCAEKLFLDLVINNKDLLIQPLLNTFYTVATPQNENVLLKDSIYSAIGIAAPVLEQHLDFATFLSSTLVPEIQILQPGYNILRRRIAILLGQWLTVKEGLDRRLVYQAFQYLLQKEDALNDEVVRVTAGRQLKNVIDPFEFAVETFIPFAHTFIDRLISLIEEVDLGETQLALLNTLNVIVIKMEHHIYPFADQIMSLLPSLWENSGDEYLMKQAILTVISSLVTSMKDSSQRYHSVILPLIENSLRPATEGHTYLLEDALELWHVVLIQTSDHSQDLINLTQYLFPMLDTPGETLQKAFELMESYFLIAPQAMLQSSPRFLSSFSRLLNAGLRRETNGTITHLADTLIQAAGNLGGRTAVESLATIMADETQFISHVVIGLKTAHDAHQTTGPNRVYSEIDGIVETDYFHVLARILLASPPTFITIVTLLPALRNHPVETTMDWLLTEWFSHFDNISAAPSKKLMCLALTSLFNLGPQKYVFGRLQEFMTLWTDVVTEITEYPPPESESDQRHHIDRGAGKDTLVYSNPSDLKPNPKDRLESPEDERRRNFLFADPVHTVPIQDFIREQLSRAIAEYGGQEVFEQDWLGDVDGDIIEGFNRIGVL